MHAREEVPALDWREALGYQLYRLLARDGTRDGVQAYCGLALGAAGLLQVAQVLQLLEAVLAADGTGQLVHGLEVLRSWGSAFLFFEEFVHPQSEQDVPPLRCFPLQVGVVYFFELLAVLSKLDDLERVYAVNEIRDLITLQAGVDGLFEDGLQLSDVDLMLMAVDLLELQVLLGGGVHVWQFGGLGQAVVPLVESAASQQELQRAGGVLAGLEDVRAVEQGNVGQEVVDCLEEIQRPVAGLGEVVTVIFPDNQRVLLDLLQHQSLDLLLRLEIMGLALQFRRQLLVDLQQDDRVRDEPNHIQNCQPFLLVLDLGQLCHHGCDVPLVGVLLQCWEGILQSHVVLLRGGVLALYDVQLLLVADVDVEAHHRDEDHGNVELETKGRDLSVCALTEVAADQQAVFLQPLLVLQQLGWTSHVGFALHVIRVHFQEVLQQDLRLVLPNVLRRVEEGRGEVSDVHSSFGPDVDMPHSRKHQVFNGLNARSTRAQQRHSRLSEPSLSLLPPEPNLPIVFVHLHGYIITTFGGTHHKSSHQYTKLSNERVMLWPSSGRARKESNPNEPKTLPAATIDPATVGFTRIAETSVVASVTAVSLSAKEKRCASWNLALVTASGIQ